MKITRDLDRSARDKAAAAHDARARNSRARAVDRSAASEETARDRDQTARKEEEAALERVRYARIFLKNLHSIARIKTSREKENFSAARAARKSERVRREGEEGGGG